MNVVLREEILRLNCPGFGEQSFLNIGKAKSLDAYKAIIVNPVSLLHLFDYGPQALNVVDAALSEGLSSISFPNDELLNSLNEEITIRTEELVRFLENGGLLIYFLCRPFILQGPALTLDNFVWLLSLAPAKSTDKNVRQMSAVATGRNIEPCEETVNSEFADYFSQTGLEWNTVIRTEFLTEGYTALATAGVRKCIAAELYAGDNGGRIVFLPAPYSPDFDRNLIECANVWYQKKLGLQPSRKEVAQAVANLLSPQRLEQKPALLKFGSQSQDSVPALNTAGTKTTGSPASESKTAPRSAGGVPPGALKPAAALSTQNKIATSSIQGSQPVGVKAAAPNNPATARTTANQKSGNPATTVGGAAPKPAVPLERKPVSPLTATNPELQKLSPPFDQAPEAPPPTNAEDPKASARSQQLAQKDINGQSPEPQQPASEPAALSKSESLVLELKQALEAKEKEVTLAGREQPDLAPQATAPRAPSSEGLIKRLEEASTASTPSWTLNYSVSELQELNEERASLSEQLKQLPARIAAIDGRLTTLNNMKNALLSGGEDMLACSMTALTSLGWAAKPSPSVKDEIWLSTLDKPEALARVVRSVGPPTRSDLAQLAESIINFWGENEVEPKGILIACVWAETPIAERQETSFPEALVDFANKKSICLLTTLQLLRAYADVEFGKRSAEEIRKSIIATSGALNGLELKTLRVTNG